MTTYTQTRVWCEFYDIFGYSLRFLVGSVKNRSYFFICISDLKFTDSKNMRNICKMSVLPFLLHVIKLKVLCGTISALLQPHLVSSHRSFIVRCDVIELSDGLSGRGDSLVFFLFSDMMEVQVCLLMLL